MYPTISGTFRTPKQDEVIPLETPIQLKTGRLVDSLRIPAGTGIFLGILGYNTSKQVFGENAAAFVSERWLDREKSTSSWTTTYSSILTFLSGTRSCVGFQFAKLEMKIVLAVLLLSFRFDP